MARELIEFWSFDEPASVSELTIAQHAPNVGNWDGTGASMQPGLSGVGQCVRSPNALRYVITSSSFASLAVKGKVRINAIGSSQKIASIGSGVAQQMDFGVSAGGTLQLIGATGVSSTHSSTVPVVVGQVYDYEVALYLHNTQGRFRVVWDNVEVAALTLDNQDTIYSAASTLDRVIHDNVNADVDDDALWGRGDKFADGDFYSAPGKSVKDHQFPMTGDGNYTGWTNVTNTGANDFNEIDESIHDGGTSRIRANAGSQRESFVHGAFPNPADVFKVVGVRTLVSHANEAATAHCSTFLRYGGNNYDGVTGGSAGATGGSPTWAWSTAVFRTDLWPLAPGTATAWEDMDPLDAIAIIDGMEVGVLQDSSTTFPTSVSQVVLQVLYIAAPTPVEPRSSAFVVALRKTHRLVKSFFFQRRDGVEYAFVDHDRTLELDGLQYEPTGGLSGTATRRELLLKDQSEEFIGIVSSDKITVDDLRAGRYRDALVVERWVDWKYPWAGDAMRSVYYVRDVRWNGRVWRAEVAGKPILFQRKIGKLAGPVCRAKLGGPICLVNMTPFTYTGVGVTTPGDRRTFVASNVDLPLLADEFFTLGELTWVTGANAGIVSTVMSYGGSSRTFTLFLPLPFDVQAGDEFDVATGCDGLFSTCRDTYLNQDNFDAEPYMPGRNKTLRGE